jgi:hypothetical protein
VKDRQSGALAQSLQGQVIRPKARRSFLAGCRAVRKTVIGPIMTALQKFNKINRLFDAPVMRSPSLSGAAKSVTIVRLLNTAEDATKPMRRNGNAMRGSDMRASDEFRRQ